jgi:sec-independent protein translocase protein TatA
MAPIVAMIGAPELLIIFAIIVLLFGASRLPGLGKSVGQSIRGLKTGLSGTDEEKPKELEAKPPEDTTPPSPPHTPPPTA